MMCEHPVFEANVQVNIIEDIKAFAADVHIKCTKCGTQFIFLGLPGGLSINYPTVSLDGTEARMPIAPMEETH